MPVCCNICFIPTLIKSRQSREFWTLHVTTIVPRIKCAFKQKWTNLKLSFWIKQNLWASAWWFYLKHNTHTHTHTHTHTYICTYICTYRHTDIQTYRHTDTQTHRHTDIQTYRHTDITYLHTHTHTFKHANFYVCVQVLVFYTSNINSSCHVHFMLCMLYSSVFKCVCIRYMFFLFL